VNIVRTGIILNTQRYEQCVAFYKELFGLRVLFEKSDDGFALTCFAYQGSYLMVETGGHASPGGKPIEHSPAKLRFNVADIEAALQTVRAYGIDADIARHDWGATIDIHDPDGNRIGIADEGKFRLQLDAAAAAD